MAMLMMMRYGKYVNPDAVENVVRYITRTRVMEDRADELVVWGGWGIGCYLTPELVIEQFCRLQDLYHIRGPRLFHEVLRLTEDEFIKLEYDYSKVYQIAMNCAQYYYAQGHQIIFAVHLAKEGCQKGNRGLHIHFVINSINFLTGNKWHTSIKENVQREQRFNDILREFMLVPEFPDEWLEG